MHTYELGHVKDLKADTYKDEPHIQKPPKCYSTGETVMVESDPQILQAWAELHGEPKMFIHAVMHAIDILAEHFSTLDLKDVKRKCNKAFNMGWKEPEFRMTTVRDLQTKREIENPDRFIHCKATMEPELTGAFEDKLHADFEEKYRKAMEEPGISEEYRKYFEDAMNSHKRHKTSKWLDVHFDVKKSVISIALFRVSSKVKRLRSLWCVKKKTTLIVLRRNKKHSAK